MKNRIFVLVLSLGLGSQAIAQEAVEVPVAAPVSRKNPEAIKRQELMAKFRGSKPVVFALYNQPENVGSSPKTTLEKVLPLSNAMSDYLGKLVVVDAADSIYKMNKNILEGVDFVYAPSTLNEEFKKNGWKLIAVRNYLSEPAIVIPSSLSAQNLKSLTGKKIISSGGVTSDFVLASLINNGVYESKEATKGNFVVSNQSNRELLKMMDEGKVDAVVMNMDAARVWTGNEKYRVISGFNGDYVAAIYASPKAPEEDVRRARDFFLTINGGSRRAREVFAAIGEYTEGRQDQFIDGESLKVASEVFKLVKQKDIFK